MREITGHKVNPANDTIDIMVTDQPGAGGANHAYRVKGFDLSKNPSAGNGVVHDGSTQSMIYFQNGPIPESGVNGVTQEVLIAICIDRLECFQAGPFANKYNQEALDHLRLAQDALLSRTRERMARGVEGTHQK